MARLKQKSPAGEGGAEFDEAQCVDRLGLDNGLATMLFRSQLASRSNSMPAENMRGRTKPFVAFSLRAPIPGVVLKPGDLYAEAGHHSLPSGHLEHDEVALVIDPVGLAKLALQGPQGGEGFAGGHGIASIRCAMGLSLSGVPAKENPADEGGALH